MFSLRLLAFKYVAPSLPRTFCRFKSKNPGIQNRLKLLSGNVDPLDEDVEDLESDFMDVHKSHTDHEQEVTRLKEREKYLIVRQKYFKEKFPNFLTWHDKEQIRYLHRTDPEEWTIDKLSEGFPALPATIIKIVKSNWTKNKQQKIGNHDKSVQNNWDMFKSGQLPDLPEELVEHLEKFTNRALIFQPFELPNREKSHNTNRLTRIGSEFTEIITSYQKLKEKTPKTDEMKNELQFKQHTTVSKSNTKMLVTLAELQKNIMDDVAKGVTIDEDDKLIVQNTKTVKVNNNKSENLIDLSKMETKYTSESNISNYVKKTTDLSFLNYPERIMIPKGKLKKGYTYKLNDCYYDDDGKFLYRVPGMIK